MWSSEPTRPGVDPDETQPFRAQPAPRRIGCGPDWAVDRAAPELARLCAGWALRNRPVEELVGHVSPVRVGRRSSLGPRSRRGSPRGRRSTPSVGFGPSGAGSRWWTSGPTTRSTGSTFLASTTSSFRASPCRIPPDSSSRCRRSVVRSSIRCIEQHLPRLRRVLVKDLLRPQNTGRSLHGRGFSRAWRHLRSPSPRRCVAGRPAPPRRRRLRGRAGQCALHRAPREGISEERRGMD